MSLKTFVDQCYKRKIFKGFSIYAIASWIIIQVAATTFPYLGIPKQAVTFIIIVVLVGLPISLIFSWYYNVVADELDEEKAVSLLSDKAAGKIFKAIILVITISVLTIVAFLISKNFKSEIKRANSNRIAVLAFKNATGDEEYDLLSRIIPDWIEHGIIENQLATVVSSEVVKNYDKAILSAQIGSDQSASVLNQLLVDRTITGGIYRDGKKLVAKCTVFKWPNSESAFAFENVEIDPENPNKGISLLRDKVLGYLISKDKKALQLQDQPPNYEAYKRVIKARELMNVLDPEALNLLEEALEIDSNYFEPKVLTLSYYYNIGEYATADSIRRTIIADSRSNSRQVNLLNFYNALLNGKNKTIYSTWKKEYDFAPFNLTSNQNMMVIALQYVYKPEIVQHFFDDIDMEGLDLKVCQECVFRVYTLASAYVELKQYKKVISLLTPHLNVGVDPVIIRPLITSYVRLGNLKKLAQIFQDLPNLMLSDNWHDLYLKAAKELILLGKNEEAQQYIEQAKEHYERDSKKYSMARAYMLEKSYEEAEVILQELYDNNELGTRGKTRLAISYHLNDRPDLAENLFQTIKVGQGKFDYGNVNYGLARIEAYRGNDKSALKYLEESVSNGYIYGPEEFHNDLAFQEIKNQNAFKQLLTYWH